MQLVPHCLSRCRYEEIDPDTCARAVEQAQQFVDAVADYITRPP
jgi:hypothetical protein